MKCSELTQKYRRGYWATLIISWIVTFSPIVAYTIIGFSQGTTGQKFALGIMLTMALALGVINVLKKLSLRSTTWLMVLGISICLNKITDLLIVMAVTTIIDELVIVPINRYCREKLSINKEIDKRG